MFLFIIHDNRGSAIFRISYMWYSFLGTVLTILLGLLISLITEQVSESKLTSIVEGYEKGDNKANDRSQNVFSLDACHKSKNTQTQLHGIDNVALKMDE